MVPLMAINLSGKENTPVMIIFIFGIRSIHFLEPRFLVLQHVDLHKTFLVLVQMIVLGVMKRHLNLVKYLLSAVMYQRKRVLFIHLPASNQLELNIIVMTIILMAIIPFIIGMKTMMLLINIQKMGCG